MATKLDERLVEAVARAICEANGEDPDKEYPVTLPGLVMSFGEWAKQWELIQPLARAAIFAMFMYASERPRAENP